jgi:ABC-type transport system involved in cytochrome c biogenesis permease subunit
MKNKKLLPWIAGVLAVLGALAAAMPPGKVRGADVAAFAQLPILEGGRVKPVDSLARNSLLMIRSQQSFRFDGKSVGPDEWLLDVMFRRDVADRQPVFVINDPEVLGLLGIRQTSDRYFSFATLQPHLSEIQRQAQVAHGIDAKQRTRYQSAIANLFDRIYLYYRLQNTMSLVGAPPLSAELGSANDPASAARQRDLAQLAYFRPVVPPAGASPEAWKNVGEALQQGDTTLASWGKLGDAWAKQDAATFNATVSEITRHATTQRPEMVSQASHEVVFNRAQPFYAGMIIYVLAMILIFASWLWRPDLLAPTAFGLLAGGAFVHTAGLVSRVLLQGRPPVTNLYSSAVFVGWGAVLLGVILERMYRRGFATAVAAAAGFASLIVAHHLTGDGDTMEMMRAVLDSNFWLGTHVLTITIGYSGTFLAGAIAIGWTLWRHLARNPDPSTGKALVGMAYGIICFALFFSFVGTVLGGIWADQSWGRFWGWDPKENGALLIVLWNAIILHARWGGYARDRGIMSMAIVGNVITALSWFGVNMLGVGLHSYGFMDSAFWALAGFCASQALIMTFTLLPRRFWAARAPASAPAAPKPRGGRGGAAPDPA